ncbi:hypothetical protein GCM10023169_09780 [Georgenia halophila]|uniref:Uncharacterized protein n=1 Tax=Georgenia halophila TaxID=620889 RepID=A0ABP8KZK1_9MICO
MTTAADSAPTIMPPTPGAREPLPRLAFWYEMKPRTIPSGPSGIPTTIAQMPMVRPADVVGGRCGNELYG